MARWIGAQGQVKLAKMAKTCPHCDVTNKKTPNPNPKIFLIETRRLVETVDGLNTSLALLTGELWLK